MNHLLHGWAEKEQVQVRYSGCTIALRNLRQDVESDLKFGQKIGRAEQFGELPRILAYR
jgi:hypothetical protein